MESLVCKIKKIFFLLNEADAWYEPNKEVISTKNLHLLCLASQLGACMWCFVCLPGYHKIETIERFKNQANRWSNLIIYSNPLAYKETTTLGLMVVALEK